MPPLFSILKRKSKASSLFNSIQLKVNDIKLSTMDTSNIENNSEVWFQNNSTNKTDLDPKKKGDYKRKQSE